MSNAALRCCLGETTQVFPSFEAEVPVKEEVYRQKDEIKVAWGTKPIAVEFSISMFKSAVCLYCYRRWGCYRHLGWKAVLTI
jgi:hypothetical protein